MIRRSGRSGNTGIGGQNTVRPFPDQPAPPRSSVYLPPEEEAPSTDFTLAATEEADTAAFTVADTVSLAATEGADTASFTVAGSVSLAATEGADTAAFTVAAAVSLAATEAPDTAAFTIAGSVALAATEDPDTAAFTVADGVVLAATEGDDVASFAVDEVAGTTTLELAATEGSDTASFDILAPIPEPDIPIGGTLLTPPRSRWRDREEEQAREALAAAERELAAAKNLEPGAIARALGEAELAVQRLQASAEVNAALVQRMLEQLAALQAQAAIERARQEEEDNDAMLIAIVLAELA